MQISFKKVVLLSFDRKVTGGTARFVAAFTATVCDRLGWGEAPEWQKQSTPTGKLVASQVDLEPKAPELAKHAMILESQLVDGFQIIRKEAKGVSSKKTKAIRTELHFSVHFNDATGARKLEQYILTANHESTMIVTYEKEAEQEELPGTATDNEAATEELKAQVEEVRKKRGAVQ